MIRTSLSLLVTSILLSLLWATHSSAYGDQPSKQVKAYYPSYNSDAQPPSQIDYSLYTDLLYFMVLPQPGSQLTYDPKLTFDQGEQLVADFVARCIAHNVRPHISAGGWTGSQHFSNLTSTEPARKEFAQALVDFAHHHGFVGIELDWEYPNGEGIGCNSRNPADVVNFGLLTKEIRALWPEALLTIAVSVAGLNGADGPATPTETALLVQNLNYINLMAYDVYGAWAPTTGPIAPLYSKCAPPAFGQSVQTGYELAKKQGFHCNQVVLGIPGYAKRSELVSAHLQPKVVDGETTYYYQNKTSTTPPGGKFDDKAGKDICGNPTGPGGSFLVNELISNGWLSEDTKQGLGGYTRYFDKCSGSPFLTNGKYFISYDDYQSTANKAQFAKDNNMGGIYFFDTRGPTSETIREAGRIISS